MLIKNVFSSVQWYAAGGDADVRERFAEVEDSPDEFSDHGTLEQIEVSQGVIAELKIFVGLLAPISNTYLTVVECLNGLLGNNCIVESEFYKICIKQLKENYRSGLNKFGKWKN